MAWLEIQISLDGNQWCALVGENLMEGFVGFGTTQIEALRNLCDDLETEGWAV